MKPLWRYLVTLPLVLSAMVQVGFPLEPSNLSARPRITNLAEFIKEKVHARKTIVVPPGVYRLKPNDDVAIPLEMQAAWNRSIPAKSR